MTLSPDKRAQVRRFAVLGAVLAGLAYLVLLRPDAHAPIEARDAKRTPLGEGIELVESSLVRDGRSVGKLAVVYAELDAVDLALRLNDEQKKIVELLDGELLMTNAGYFTKERRATGLLASHGHILSPFVPEAGGAGSGVFVVEDGRATLIERDHVKGKKFRTSDIAIQAGPRVIEPGGRRGIKSDDGLRANRTFVGADKEGRLMVGVAYAADGGGSLGPTLFELMTLMLDGETDLLLNLDGGPSTGFHLRAAEHVRDHPEANRVHSVLSVVARR